MIGDPENRCTAMNLASTLVLMLSYIFSEISEEYSRFLASKGITSTWTNPFNHWFPEMGRSSHRTPWFGLGSRMDSGYMDVFVAYHPPVNLSPIRALYPHSGFENHVPMATAWG